jgi:hypothetical protein
MLKPQRQRHSGAEFCVAGHVGLELRNVRKNYPFERSSRFPGIKPNSGHRDYSLLSCGGGETQLGPLAGRGQQPAMPVIGFLSFGWPITKMIAAFHKGLNGTGYVEGGFI